MSALTDKLESKGFSAVAARKICSLMHQDNFKGVMRHNEVGVELRFVDENCNVDKFGKVTWVNLDDNNTN